MFSPPQAPLTGMLILSVLERIFIKSFFWGVYLNDFIDIRKGKRLMDMVFNILIRTQVSEAVKNVQTVSRIEMKMRHCTEGED